MARNNTQNNAARAYHNGVLVEIVRRGDKNSRVRVPGQTATHLVATASLTGHYKIEKVKVVDSIPTDAPADSDASTVAEGSTDMIAEGSPVAAE
jgi:hypothetical protein